MGLHCGHKCSWGDGPSRAASHKETRATASLRTRRREQENDNSVVSLRHPLTSSEKATFGTNAKRRHASGSDPAHRGGDFFSADKIRERSINGDNDEDGYVGGRNEERRLGGHRRLRGRR